MRKLFLVGLALLVATPAVHSQQKGAIELGGLARFTDYDDSFDRGSKTENSWGAGGRLGWFILKNFSLELDGSYNATDQNNALGLGSRSRPLDFVPFHLRAIYHAPLGSDRVHLLIGGGPGVNFYTKDEAIAGFDGTDVGVGGLVGLRVGLLGPLSLRVDGLVDYVPDPANDANDNTTLGAQAGLSLIFKDKCTTRIDSIWVTPATVTLQPGQSQQFTVTGLQCDGRSRQLRAPVVGFDAQGGTMTSDGFFTAGTAAGSFPVTATHGKHLARGTVTIRPNVVERVALAPASARLRPGESARFVATAHFTDGTTQTTGFTWSGQGGTVADGNYTAGQTPGTYQVTATRDGRSANASIEIYRPAPAVRDTIILPGALFQSNRAQIFRPTDRDSLESVVEALRANPEVRVVVEGHTDWTGRAASNADLSRRRAEAVKTWLLEQGIDAGRIELRWYGECNPRASNDTEEGKQANRRAEMHRVETAGPARGNQAQCADRGPNF